ncbi:hypothetical protein [Sphingobium sp.]|jgi:hypothetical protein|uniref:hypothetical protein n=1 Tax=Sphingobium sp. TaxID=1912891 RepID=UPI000DB0E07C|nr:hypothetical protein [Sphingobium sp.]PZU65206.1 MAG: hypothetical protein DI540_17705 [Sphingobium sp.]
MENATRIEVEAEVRYWEDASVNGVEDTDGTLIYGRDVDQWKISIDLTDGIVIGWPEGMEADIHYKVCDQGEYWLTDDAGNRLAKWGGHYVPNEFLCHGDEGYGDYIIMSVAIGGGIVGYQQPEIDPARWVVLP